MPRQVLIDTDGRPAVSDVMKNKTSSRTLPPPCSHPHHLSRKKGTSLMVAPDKKTLKKSVKSMFFMVQTRCEVETIKY